MRYCWTTIIVKDLERSLAFYCDIVGLPIVRQLSGAHGNIVFLRDSDTNIELIENPHAAVVTGNRISLGFAVDSLDAMLEFVASKKIDVESGPFRPNEHIRFFYVLDPDGVRVQFSESM